MAETYNFYVDVGEGLVLVESDIVDLFWLVSVGPLLYNKVYSWRVDATNEYGTTEGDEWSFTTLKFGPPLPSGVTLTDVEGETGVEIGTPSGENNIITIRKLVAAAEDKVWFEVI